MFDENSGTNKLANVIVSRIKKEGESPLFLDFGEIQENESLTTNTFPVAIPKGQYSICRHVSGVDEFPALCVGDRVLVAWVSNEAVVIDVIKNS